MLNVVIVAEDEEIEGAYSQLLAASFILIIENITGPLRIYYSLDCGYTHAQT